MAMRFSGAGLGTRGMLNPMIGGMPLSTVFASVGYNHLLPPKGGL
jgi:hypothetical protein